MSTKMVDPVGITHFWMSQAPSNELPSDKNILSKIIPTEVNTQNPKKQKEISFFKNFMAYQPSWVI